MSTKKSSAKKGSTRKRKKKKGNKVAGGILRILVLLLVLWLLGVGIWQLRAFLSSNASTGVATERTLGNYYSGTLVIARNETLYETENMTSIDFVADEGSSVSRSGVICKVYSSGYNQTEISRLQTYREEIQNYHVNQVFNSYVDAALDSENSEIAVLAQQVRTLVQGKGQGSLSNLERQLTSSLTVRKNYLRQKYPDDQTLSELYKVENDQLKKIESWTTTYTASEDCMVSFYTDGYENAINARTYSTLTPSDVRNVIRGIAPEQSTISRGSDPIFRTIVDDEWFALFLCQDRNWNPVVGEAYQIQLEGFSNMVTMGEVVSFTRIGSDLLLRMRVTEQSVEPVLNTRTCTATVGDFVSGFNVPIRALYTLNDQMGVVVLNGSTQIFVQTVVISYPDSETAFVRPVLSGSPLQNGVTLMLF